MIPPRIRLGNEVETGVPNRKEQISRNDPFHHLTSLRDENQQIRCETQKELFMDVRFRRSHFMNTLATVSLLAALALSSSCAGDAAFTAPPAERIAAILEFSAPVTLTRRIASPKDLARASKRKGVPLASFSYSDPAHTSDSITVTVYAAGAFLGAKRTEMNDWIHKHSIKAGEGFEAIGVFPTTDGRSCYQFPLGFGPGGSAYGAILPCRDSRYELVVVQSTDFHDGEKPKGYSHHVSPKKDLQSVIEEIEYLVLP